MASPGGGRQRRIVLHFDINKTVVMKDSRLPECSTVTSTLAILLASEAWGRLQQKGEETVWQLAVD